MSQNTIEGIVPRRVLLIGATGMLGRPVARACVADECLKTTAFVRDIDRARRLLPGSIQLIHGNLHDEESLVRAMDGADSVYVNLNTPFSQRVNFDPDRDGTALVLRAARRAGVPHILRLSAIEVNDPAHQWWSLRRKEETDQRVRESGLDWTIFKPTWFMENLALFVQWRFISLLAAPTDPLWWIAGADFGNQVAAAMKCSAARNRQFIVQGPEGVSLGEATKRFARAHSPKLLPAPMPRLALRAAGLLFAQPRYGADLLQATFERTAGFEATETWDILGKPTMRIEDYAQSIEQTGDRPRKPLWSVS